MVPRMLLPDQAYWEELQTFQFHMVILDSASMSF